MNRLKTLLIVPALLAACALRASAATTINPANHFAYGANIGWIDWRGDVNNGAVLGESVCSGFIYRAHLRFFVQVTENPKSETNPKRKTRKS